VERFIRRKNEYAWLHMVPKNENGVASQMPHLSGLYDGALRRYTVDPDAAGGDDVVLVKMSYWMGRWAGEG
jgi:hypothetical protein